MTLMFGYYFGFFQTVDEKGNPCKEYFTNLDRIEIVSDAYNYVANLWKKGSCDCKCVCEHRQGIYSGFQSDLPHLLILDCFKRAENGTLIPEVTEDVTDFILLYQLTKSCFDAHIQGNDTCIKCKSHYEQLNGVYIDMVEKYGDNVCLDLVDTVSNDRHWSTALCYQNVKFINRV